MEDDKKPEDEMGALIDPIRKGILEVVDKITEVSLQQFKDKANDYIEFIKKLKDLGLTEDNVVALAAIYCHSEMAQAVTKGIEKGCAEAQAKQK